MGWFEGGIYVFVVIFNSIHVKMLVTTIILIEFLLRLYCLFSLLNNHLLIAVNNEKDYKIVQSRRLRGAESVFYKSLSELDNIKSFIFSKNFYEPTEDEISRGVLVGPPVEWAEPIRPSFDVDNDLPSLRILLLGGSNTANDISYSAYLTERLKALKKENILNHTSYVLNKGISANPPSVFLGRNYEFFLKPVQEWPNLVIIEFIVNCEPTNLNWDMCPIPIERLIHCLLYAKWDAKNVTRPAVLILNLFGLANMFDEYEARKGRNISDYVLNDYATSHLGPMVNGVNVGLNNFDAAGMLVSELGRFYRYPVISLKDALWPSFIRYYATHNGSHNLWPYLRDGNHINELGHELLVDKLIIPLLLSQLQNRPNHSSIDWKISQVFNRFAIRFFSSEKVYQCPGHLALYSSWGESENTLNDVIFPASKGFTFAAARHHEKDGKHICFRSEPGQNEKAVAYFRIDVSGQWNCKEGVGYPCVLNIHMLHSWDTSYIGNTTCSLFKSNLEDRAINMLVNEESSFKLNRTEQLVGSPLHIIGNYDSSRGHAVRDTTVRVHTAYVGLTHPGFYILECRPDNEPNLFHRNNLTNCIAGFDITASEKHYV